MHLYVEYFVKQWIYIFCTLGGVYNIIYYVISLTMNMYMIIIVKKY